MIAYGRTVNSFAGGFNTLTTSGIYAFNQLDVNKVDSDLNFMVDIIEGGMTEDQRAKIVGKRLGIIFTKLYNVQVPEVEFKTLS